MLVKLFHVRYRDVDRESTIAAMQGKSLAFHHYEPVAFLEVASLGEAFEVSNHINSDWTENRQVVQLLGGKQLRSTSVGDMLETSEGLFVVAPLGFVPWSREGN